MAWQDEYQQARCWFGAGISQQLQGESDAALQSLDVAEQLLSWLLEQTPGSKRRVQDCASQHSSILDEETRSADRTVKPHSQASKQTSSAQPLAVKSLWGKVLLAKASIFKQLKQTHQANACMKSAKKLDPAIGKNVRD